MRLKARFNGPAGSAFEGSVSAGLSVAAVESIVLRYLQGDHAGKRKADWMYTPRYRGRAAI
jgi:hypothetical protein